MRILSLGPVVAARFQVRDYATPPMTAYYEFRGGSLSFGTPISFAGQGGWNEFTPLLSRPARASDFGGPVSWGGLSMPIQTPRGVEFFDATELTLNGVPGLPYVFRPFRSGNTIGAGIGVSAGLMGVDSPLVPYPGPEGGL